MGLIMPLEVDLTNWMLMTDFRELLHQLAAVPL